MADETEYLSSEDEDYLPSPAEEDDVSDEDDNLEDEFENSVRNDSTSDNPSEQKDPEEQKRRVNAIWAEFLSDTGEANQKNTNAEQPSDGILCTDSNQKDVIEYRDEAEILNKPNEIQEPSTSDGGKISPEHKEVYTFAGEEVRISRENATKLLTPSNKESAKRTMAPLVKKDGLSAVASMISAKRKKLTVLDKTAHDWQELVDEEGLEDELTYHERSKDSYLDKQDFLLKADYSAFEKEKNLRNLTRN